MIASCDLEAALFNHVTSVWTSRTVKLWSLGSNVSAAKKVSALWTVLAHEKDINCVEVSPDNKIIASGSQGRAQEIIYPDS